MTSLTKAPGSVTNDGLYESIKREFGEHGKVDYRGWAVTRGEAPGTFDIIRWNSRWVHVCETHTIFYLHKGVVDGDLDTMPVFKVNAKSGGKNIRGKVTEFRWKKERDSLPVAAGGVVIFTKDGVYYTAQTSAEPDKKKAKEATAFIRERLNTVIASVRLTGAKGDKWFYATPALDLIYSDDYMELTEWSALWTWRPETRTRELVAGDDAKRFVNNFINRNKAEIYKRSGVFENTP